MQNEEKIKIMTKFIQVKAIRKGSKPPIWRRMALSVEVTFAELADVLAVALEFPSAQSYEFEFYNRKERVVSDISKVTSNYQYQLGAELLAKEWLENEKWFTLKMGENLPEYRVEMEGEVDVQHTTILKQVAPSEDEYWQSKEAVQERLDALKGENAVWADENEKEVEVSDLIDSYGKADLCALAGRVGCELKDDIIPNMRAQLVSLLLSKKVMGEQLLLATKEELDAFDQAMRRGSFIPTPGEWSRLTIFYDLNYIAIFADNTVEVPKEVKLAYEELLKTGYAKFHAEASWLLTCLRVFQVIYLVAPVKILYRMYKEKRHIDSDYPHFEKVLAELPDYLMACRVVKDKVIAKHVLEDGSEKRAEMLQRNVEFYIPTVEEILTYAKDGYPSCEKSYQELFRFYLEDMELGEDRARNLCLHAFHTFVASGKVNDYMEIVNRERIIFRSEEMVKKFTHILEEVSQNTRMFELRGHKPKEVAKKVSLQAPAHTFLSKPQKQQEKKIYPNDPCPCGSGKKYKKCCGRNK